MRFRITYKHAALVGTRIQVHKAIVKSFSSVVGRDCEVQVHMLEDIESQMLRNESGVQSSEGQRNTGPATQFAEYESDKSS